MITTTEAARIKAVVCEVFAASEAQFETKARSIDLVYARWAAWQAVAYYRKGTANRIMGEMLGKRDASTVNSAINHHIPLEMTRDKGFAAKMSEVLNSLTWLQGGVIRNNSKAAIVADLRNLSLRLFSGNAAHTKGALLQIANNIEVLL